MGVNDADLREFVSCSLLQLSTSRAGRLLMASGRQPADRPPPAPITNPKGGGSILTPPQNGPSDPQTRELS